MKKLKLSAMIFVLGFGFTGLAYAQGAPATSPPPQARPSSAVADSVNSANAGQALTGVNENMVESTDTLSEGVKDTVFDQAREKGEAEQAQSMLEQLQGKPESAVSANQLMGIMTAIEQGAAKCESYVEEGVNCCKNPQSCGGSENSAAGQADQAAQQTSQQAQQAAGGAGGGGGAAAQCLGALPGLMAMTAKSNGTGKACGLIREGNGDQKGCRDICKGFRDLARAAGNRASAFSADPSQRTTAQNIITKAEKITEETSKAIKTCSSETATGQQAANAQAGTGAQAMQGLMGCLQALMSGEETQEEGLEEEEESPVAVNCKNSAEAAANPDYCPGVGGYGADDGNLSKTSGNNLSILDGEASADLLDPVLGGENGGVNGTPAPPGAGGSSMKTSNPAMAALPGGGAAAGAAGANRKAGKGKEKKDLIGGYKTAKGGGGGGYGRSPSSKKFKPFSFGKKKGTGKDKKALAALSKLMKAGISPDQTGSIFVRASKRFASSSAKEKLFDARRNRSMWMEKRK